MKYDTRHFWQKNGPKTSCQNTAKVAKMLSFLKQW
jgi:hypothetical protein